jgi:hypothetical protein
MCLALAERSRRAAIAWVAKLRGSNKIPGVFQHPIYAEPSELSADTPDITRPSGQIRPNIGV